MRGTYSISIMCLWSYFIGFSSLHSNYADVFFLRFADSWLQEPIKVAREIRCLINKTISFSKKREMIPYFAFIVNRKFNTPLASTISPVPFTPFPGVQTDHIDSVH